MFCEIKPIESIGDYKFVVILSAFNNHILLSRHRERATWETQGGHIEAGETPMEAARRELFEESGATDFEITPLFDYTAGDEDGSASGMVFYSRIKVLGELPKSERDGDSQRENPMAEVKEFESLPQNVTYPGITPHLFRKAVGLGLFGEKTD